MGILLLIGLIGLLIALFFTVRNAQRDSSLKSKYKNSARFAFASGIFCFFVAFVFYFAALHGYDFGFGRKGGMGALFDLAFYYLGIKGVVGLFALFGIISILKARSLKRKSEQIEEKEGKAS